MSVLTTGSHLSAWNAPAGRLARFALNGAMTRLLTRLADLFLPRYRPADADSVTHRLRELVPRSGQPQDLLGRIEARRRQAP